MFTLSLLSLIHTWVLPGLIVFCIVPGLKFFDKLILSFPLSLLINYHLVNLLIFFKIYDYYLVNLIIFIELIFLLFIFIKKYKLVKQNLQKIIFKDFKFRFDIIDIFNSFVFFLYLYLAINSIGGVIPLGDGIVNFNSWAIEMYNQKIPLTWGWYTLAIPASLSIIYKASNNYEIQFFSLAFFTIYPCLMFIIFYRISNFFKKNKYQNNLIRISCLISSLLILNVFRHYALYVGYVDPILCYHTILSIYILFLVINKKIYNFNNLIIFFGIISLGFLIKPNGLYNSLFFGLILLYFFLKNKLDNQILYIFLISQIIFIGPTFLYKFINIYYFNDPDASLALTQQFNHSLSYKLKNSILYAFGVFSILLPFIFFIKKEKIYIFSILAYFLPWFMIWAILFQYDNRNLAFTFPVLAFPLACGIYNFILYFKRLFNVNKILNYLVAFIIIFVLIFFLAVQLKRSESILFEKNLVLLKKRGSIEVNALLYHYFQNKLFDIKVYTSTNNEFDHLPEIGYLFEYLACSKNLEQNIEDRISRSKKLKKIYFLIRPKDQNCANFPTYFLKNYPLIFKESINNYYLFKIK